MMDIKTGIFEPVVQLPAGMDCREPIKKFVISGPTIITPPVNMVLIDKSYYEQLSKEQS